MYVTSYALFLEVKKLILRREYNGCININPIIRAKAHEKLRLLIDLMTIDEYGWMLMVRRSW